MGFNLAFKALKPGGNYMYHKDGFKDSMRLHKGPRFGWGEEGRLVTFPIVPNMFCIELNSYTGLPTLLVQYCVAFVCLFWRDSPQWARASSFTRFLDHTRRTTFGRTPLED